MLETLPLLEKTYFPEIQRNGVSTLQVNLGYLCNQQCQHCHVNAGPNRKELMDQANIRTIVEYIEKSDVQVLDLTGGAPELNPEFKNLVKIAREKNISVIDRCNLTILEEPGQESLADFLAENNVQIMASLPCYLEDNVDTQRGKGVYTKSIAALKRLNRLGYGEPETDLLLNLVHNPVGPTLPASQKILETDYKQILLNKHGIKFNNLFVIANMPIKRFGSALLSNGQFDDYMGILKNSHKEDNLKTVMCRDLISVDWQGYVYDCDFNQMLNLPLLQNGKSKIHLSELIDKDLSGLPINVKGHCYGCTAGQGSSCGGALV